MRLDRVLSKDSAGFFLRLLRVILRPGKAKAYLVP